MLNRKDLNLNESPINCKDKGFGDTLVSVSKIEFIKSKVIELNDLQSSIAEIGVYKGGTAKIILETMNKISKLFLFDTFEGIPNSCEFDNIHIVGDFNDIPYEDIVNFFNKYNNVLLCKGIFPQDTAKFIENETFKLIHLDVDTYISYKESLEFLYDKLIIGGYIIFDDYNESTCMGATKAINEFFENKREKIRQNNGSYYIIKE